MDSSKKAFKVFYTVLIIVLVLALLLGLAYFIVRVLRKESGMYVRVNGTYVSSSNSGIDFDVSEDVVFQICNDGGFGSYKVSSASVYVLNNVKSGSSHDFQYSTGTETVIFSDVEDYTSAFSKNGGDIIVDEDGYFSLCFQQSIYMDSYLSAYYGRSIFLNQDICLSDYPYFYLHIVSPDGEDTLDIPFTLSGVYVSLGGVGVYPDGILF